ncbi:MAG: hypothetical protein ACRDJU_09285, partial [Actinomycetota bacterium]
MSPAVDITIAALTPIVVAIPIHIALKRRIRERSWVIGCCGLPALADLGAWIAYLRSSPPASTFPCIAPNLPPGRSVVCEPIPAEVQAALHQAAMLRLAWILFGVAVGFWFVALAISFRARPGIRPPWEPFSFVPGPLPKP